MSRIKLVATIAICIGLVLPSAHSIAVCVDGEGSFTLEAAVNGACAGSDSRCCEEETPAEHETAPDGCSADHCGSCRDIVVNGAGMGSPVPTCKAALRISQPVTDSAFVVEEEPSSGSATGDRTLPAFRAQTAERSPPRSTAVLRL
jgi:hypothetical protein